MPRAAAKTRPRQARSKHQSTAAIIAIGLFKLVKALGLLAVGLGALRFLHKDVAASIAHWVQVLRVDPDNRFIHPLLSKALRVTPAQLKELSAGTFFYAALLMTEGIGLLLRRHWAEYFTIITTAMLLPLEIYEIAKHVTIVKLAVLAVNAGIVWYLVMRVRARR